MSLECRNMRLMEASRDCLLGLYHQWRKCKTLEPPRAAREVAAPSRNPDGSSSSPSSSTVLYIGRWTFGIVPLKSGSGRLASCGGGAWSVGGALCCDWLVGAWPVDGRCAAIGQPVVLCKR